MRRIRVSNEARPRGWQLRDTELYSLIRHLFNPDGQDKRMGRHNHLLAEFRKESDWD